MIVFLPCPFIFLQTIIHSSSAIFPSGIDQGDEGGPFMIEWLSPGGFPNTTGI